jgi:hypothetical protein
MDIYLAHILCTSNADLPEHLHYLHYSEWLQQLKLSEQQKNSSTIHNLHKNPAALRYDTSIVREDSPIHPWSLKKPTNVEMNFESIFSTQTVFNIYPLHCPRKRTVWP